MTKKNEFSNPTPLSAIKIGQKIQVTLAKGETKYTFGLLPVKAIVLSNAVWPLNVSETTGHMIEEGMHKLLRQFPAQVRDGLLLFHLIHKWEGAPFPLWSDDFSHQAIVHSVQLMFQNDTDDVQFSKTMIPRDPSEKLIFHKVFIPKHKVLAWLNSQTAATTLIESNSHFDNVWLTCLAQANTQQLRKELSESLQDDRTHAGETEEASHADQNSLSSKKKRVTVTKDRKTANVDSVTSEHDTLPYKDLPSAAQALTRAISDAVQAYDAGGDLHEESEAYEKAARSFAALILAERIRRHCQGMETTDRASGFSLLATSDQTVKFTRELRHWLAPWGLGFGNPSGNEAYQVYARKNVANMPQGTLTLTKYGPSEPESPKHLSAWRDVANIVSSAKLVDVVAYSERPDAPKRSR